MTVLQLKVTGLVIDLKFIFGKDYWADFSYLENSITQFYRIKGGGGSEHPPPTNNFLTANSAKFLKVFIKSLNFNISRN